MQAACMRRSLLSASATAAAALSSLFIIFVISDVVVDNGIRAFALSSRSPAPPPRAKTLSRADFPKSNDYHVKRPSLILAFLRDI